MIEMNCTHVRESAAEFALDILEPAERSAIAAHLLRCPECRQEVDVMAGVGTRLLELVPGTEPPLGFDRRVLARMPQPGNQPRGAEWRPITGRNRGGVGRRPRILAAAASAAAAVALVFGSLGWFAGRHTMHTPVKATVTAVFHQGHRSVGTVEVYASQGSSPWVSMTVQGAGTSEKVTCELIGTNGSHTPLGSFDLVDGSGSWGAPDRAGLAGVSGAQLVSSDGQVIATAVFSS